MCVPDVPDGWIGPVTRALGASIPDCPAEYPTLEADANANLDVPGAICSCSCSSISVSCLTVRHVGYGGVCPKDPQGENTLVNGQCVVTNDTRGFRQPPATATCDKPVSDANVPPAVFKDKARICGGGIEAGTCSGTGLCAARPAGGFEKVCIYRTGEEPCPADYPDQTILYNDLSDTRACSPCSCTPNGAHCTGSITAFQTMDCTGPSAAAKVNDSTTVDDPLCVPFNWVSVKYNSSSVTASGSCDASGGALEGEVTTAGATTVCCAE